MTAVAAAPIRLTTTHTLPVQTAPTLKNFSGRLMISLFEEFATGEHTDTKKPFKALCFHVLTASDIKQMTVSKVKQEAEAALFGFVDAENGLVKAIYLPEAMILKMKTNGVSELVEISGVSETLLKNKISVRKLSPSDYETLTNTHISLATKV